jgi:glycosyltransferase involved in cell wall biosynthesis
VVSSCDAYVCYSEQNRDVLSKFVSPDRLFVARNTVNAESLFELRRRFDEQGCSDLRRELGLNPDLPYLCFIGRLQDRKRPDVLLEACAVLRAGGIRAGVVFIGEGPMHENLVCRAKELQLSDVVFTGARYGEEAARYLYASSVMAMPGALGLAAAHSMALGVPVVTQRLGVGLVGHGPEAIYVEDGVNGRMAERGGAATFAAALRDAMSRRGELSRGAIEFAHSNLRLDDMIDGFVRAIAYATE